MPLRLLRQAWLTVPGTPTAVPPLAEAGETLFPHPRTQPPCRLLLLCGGVEANPGPQTPRHGLREDYQLRRALFLRALSALG